MVELSKFTSNKKIFSEVVALGYNQVCSQTLSLGACVNIDEKTKYIVLCNMIKCLSLANLSELFSAFGSCSLTLYF